MDAYKYLRSSDNSEYRVFDDEHLQFLDDNPEATEDNRKLYLLEARQVQGLVYLQPRRHHTVKTWLKL